MSGVLELAGDYIDIVKLGWGTSYVAGKLAEKLRLYRDAGIPVMTGGTLLEAAIARDRLDEFRKWTADHGFTHIEVSDGTIDLERGRKVELIASLAEDYVVLSEVGTKDSERIYAPYQWVAWIKEELEAGAFKVITEARESGTSGIFRQTGEVRSGLIDEIVHEVPLNQLLFEAPQKEQQAWFIRHFGADVNLGNIARVRRDPARDAAARPARRHDARPPAARPAARVTPAAAIAVDAPAAVAAKATYALEELTRICAASAAAAYPSAALPASEAAWRLFAGEDAPAPRAGERRAGRLRRRRLADIVMSTFWHLSRWEERPGSARDERGRFPASAALFDPEAAAADRLVEQFREIAGAPARPGPLTVALTHDIDTPWRWSGARAVAGAAARAKAAAVARRPRELARELRGLAGLPRHRARGTDPNWCFERICEIERSHGGFSTYFVLAGHHHPADGAAPTRLRARPPGGRHPGARAGRRAGPAPELHGVGGRRPDRGGARAARGAGRRRGARRPLPLPPPRRPHDASRARPARVRLRLEPGLRRPPGDAGRPVVPLPAVRPGRGPAARRCSSCRSS